MALNLTFTKTTENPALLTINGGGSGIEIRYTKDGTIPTAESTLYTEPFEIEYGDTIKARAFQEGYEPSGISTFSNYTPTVSFQKLCSLSQQIVHESNTEYVRGTEFNPELGNQTGLRYSPIFFKMCGKYFMYMDPSGSNFAPSSFDVDVYNYDPKTWGDAEALTDLSEFYFKSYWFYSEDLQTWNTIKGLENTFDGSIRGIPGNAIPLQIFSEDGETIEFLVIECEGSLDLYKKFVYAFNPTENVSSTSPGDFHYNLSKNGGPVGSLNSSLGVSKPGYFTDLPRDLRNAHVYIYKYSSLANNPEKINLLDFKINGYYALASKGSISVTNNRYILSLAYVGSYPQNTPNAPSEDSVLNESVCFHSIQLEINKQSKVLNVLSYSQAISNIANADGRLPAEDYFSAKYPFNFYKEGYFYYPKYTISPDSTRMPSVQNYVKVECTRNFDYDTPKEVSLSFLPAYPTPIINEYSNGINLCYAISTSGYSDGYCYYLSGSREENYPYYYMNANNTRCTGIYDVSYSSQAFNFTKISIPGTSFYDSNGLAIIGDFWFYEDNDPNPSSYQENLIVANSNSNNTYTLINYPDNNYIADPKGEYDSNYQSARSLYQISQIPGEEDYFLMTRYNGNECNLYKVTIDDPKAGTDAGISTFTEEDPEHPVYHLRTIPIKVNIEEKGEN